MKNKTIKEKFDALKTNIAEVIVGLEEVTEMMLVSLISGGHILLEGPPGLGKTTMAKTFAQSIGGSFNRVQMTPDMLPSDILGVNVYNPLDYTWVLRRGPIFSNLVLLDELNRASPKVQSAFLQVMQELQVTIENETLEVPQPFMVIATQLPLGELGTYPLTNVQVDRFAYRIELGNPSAEVELEIIQRIDSIEVGIVEGVISGSEILELMAKVRTVHIEPVLEKYIVDIVQDIRNNDYIRLGPSPRASIWLYKGAKALALVRGREFVVPDDVKGLVKHVVPHRIELNQEARFQEIQLMTLIKETLNRVPVPKGFDD